MPNVLKSKTQAILNVWLPVWQLHNAYEILNVLKLHRVSNAKTCTEKQK